MKQPTLPYSALLLLFLIPLLSFAQGPPKIYWQKTLGNDGFDVPEDVQETNDNHIIVAGYSSSSAGNEKAVATYLSYVPGVLSTDYWIYKLNKETGAIIWQQNYGSKGDDFAHSVDPTNDNGFIVCGQSNDGATGNRTTALKGVSDAYVIKLNSTGGKVWENSYGGSGDEVGTIRELPSGDLIMAVNSTSPASTGNKSATYYGGTDVWLVKLNSTGGILWEKSFGGTGVESARVVPTSDGGFLLYGITNSAMNGNKTTATNGMEDGWLLKLDGNGNLQWEVSLGGIYNDEVGNVTETSTGGFMVVLNSESGIGGNKTSPYYGTPSASSQLDDVWVVHLDASGTIVWQRTLGTYHDDDLATIIGTDDCNFLISTTTYPVQNGDKTAPFYGNTDMWVVKIDGNGDILWQDAFGGLDYDGVPHLLQMSNGNIILAGQSISNISGRKTENCRNQWDHWILNLYNSEYWDYGFEDPWASPVEQHIVRNSVTEGEDRYWSVVKHTNGPEYWVHGVDKTSGNPKRPSASSTSFRHAFTLGGNPNEYDAPTLHDFSGDLLVAGGWTDGMIKYRVNKSTGAAISPTIVSNTFIGSGYSPMFPHQALSVGPEDLIIGSIQDNNQSTPYWRPMVVTLNSSFNVQSIVHYVDNSLQAHMTASRAISIAGGSEMLIVGGVIDPSGQSPNRIFLLHTDNTGSVLSPAQYYEATNPNESVSVADITIAEDNGDYVIGFTFTTTSGTTWPGAIGLNSGFSPQWAKHYRPNGMGTLSGQSGQMMNSDGNALFSVSLDRPSQRLPGTFNLDFASGNPLPENFLYHNPYYQERTTNSSLVAGNGDVLIAAQHAGGPGFTLLTTNSSGFSKGKCQEYFNIVETNFDRNHFTQSIQDQTLTGWNEMTISVNLNVESGDRYSCAGPDHAFRVAVERPEPMVSPTSSTSPVDYEIVQLELGRYQLQADAVIESVELMDLSGRRVQASTSIRGSLVNVDLREMPQGIYLLRANTSDGPISAKLLK